MRSRLLAWLHILLAPWHPPPAPTPAPPPVALSKPQLAALMPELLSRNMLETTPQWTAGGRRLAAQLTLRADLQKRLSTVLQASRAEYVAVAAVDARTGAVKCLLSRSPEASPPPLVTHSISSGPLVGSSNMASYDTRGPLVLRAAFPAASVFKLVTAAAAIDTHQARPESAIAFRGGDHELYHFSVRETASGKRMRRMTLREAFAHSVNPVFARLGAETVGTARLTDYARRFGFGVRLPADFPVETGQLGLTEGSEGGWSLAETASGYNWRTQMSAVQAAVFAGAMANEGVAMEPYLADTVITANGDVLYRGHVEPWHPIVSPLSAGLVRELMRETVKSGTARAAFAGFHGIDVGGKTGTLQNLTPKGRCDWFAGFAERDEEKLGFAVLVVHTRPGQAKAAAIARALISAYFQPAAENARPADITFRNADFVEIDE